jgi:hypothetical protein
MPTLSLIWGSVVFVGFCIGLIPCLGWLNWATIPLGVIGVILSVVAMAQAGSERARPASAVTGLVLSTAAVCLGLLRLVIGGGVL